MGREGGCPHPLPGGRGEGSSRSDSPDVHSRCAGERRELSVRNGKAGSPPHLGRLLAGDGQKRRAGDGVFPGGSGERRRSGDGEGTEGAILPDGLLDGSPPGHRAGGPSSPPGGRFDPDRLSRAIPGPFRNLGGTGPLLLPKCPGTGGEGHTAGIEGGASLGPAAGYLLSGEIGRASWRARR